ncbi:zinc-binding alcohol dehydrogenase [Salinicola sp. DM10]|uniref:zinc-dependent alcohol dehydrogenase n=1 Tax=Salinicola sp. DM10 TaxID=2815721 RepID=UPI001A8E07C6|nr:zinc-binding alcohol dehydrogenase [Salinicola sp. DM10]MCE3027417.1 zinc-binding alcohol dehydrogenase [Salinicola sp. DM10]
MTIPYAHAFWSLGDGSGEISQAELSDAGELMVRTCYSAISRGSETLVFNGQVPPSEYARMRAPFQSGDFPGPVKYGYSNVGVVEQGAHDWHGRHVYCLYPHQTHYRIAASDVVRLPEDVPPQRAVLGANMETALNAMWDAAPAAGDRISVVGAGVVGALVAWLCAKLPGAQVQLIDIDERKRFLGSALGVEFVTPADAADERDLVIHASASDAGLQTALAIAGFEASVVELSWYGSREVNLPLGEAFHARRLTLRSSQVGSVSPSHRARWNHKRRLSLALSLLNDECLDVLISGESHFRDLPQTLARLSRSDDDTLCERIRYD